MFLSTPWSQCPGGGPRNDSLGPCYVSKGDHDGNLFTGMVSPKKSSKTKYSANVKGGYNANSFKDYRLPTSMFGALVSASNQSLALTTWSSYKTAENHLRQCEIDTGIKMRFPMNDRDVILSNFKHCLPKPFDEAL